MGTWSTAIFGSDTAADARGEWLDLVRDIPDELIDEVEVPPPPEQAEVDALWAQLNDVIQEDKWPKELYWGGI